MRGSQIQVRPRRGRDGCTPTPAVSEPRPSGNSTLHEIERLMLAEFQTVRAALTLAIEAALASNVEAAQTLTESRADLDARHAELHSRLLSSIALQWPVGGDLRLAIALLHVNDRLSRIGAECTRIADLSLSIPPGHAPTPAQLRCLGSMARLAQDQLRDAETIFTDRHYDGPGRISERDLQVVEHDHLWYDIAVQGIHASSREIAFIVAMIARAFERIGDNAVDIARQAAFVATGRFGAT
jgi:phosphate transport system protein